ncbi:MAG TPA: class I SAM-dependent rRNA methyltransferase [bacterium]|nr:class I SAM-dependent rRNA methyltransferase [bacterium]
MGQVLINQKGFQWLRTGHPWVYRSDLPDLERVSPEPGSVVAVLGPGEKFLGQAFCNPRSQITLRMLTRSRDPIEKDFWKRRIEAAIERRGALARDKERAVRLIHGESDGLPSVILDRYGDVLVFQTLSAGADRLKETFIEIFEDVLKPAGIVERNDAPVRDLEGLVKQKGVVRGNLPRPLFFKEGGLKFSVDPLEGQKTGAFLDQAENHVAARNYVRGRALDLFSYQGGFALSVATAAQEVLAVDSSAPALAALQENAALNGIGNVTTWEANGFDFLRECDERKETFDAVILDPPPFVRDKKNVTGAVRGYKEINLRALKILKPGGILITCSCSQNFTPEMFEETLKEASRDTRRELQVLERRGAAPDHPVLLTFPESNYLQCWILRVL